MNDRVGNENPMKILTIVGARPQFIKAAALTEATKAFNVQAGLRAGIERIEEASVHTGKHYDYNMDRLSGNPQ